MALPQQLAIAERRLHREQARARVVEKEVLRRRQGTLSEAQHHIGADGGAAGAE